MDAAMTCMYSNALQVQSPTYELTNDISNSELPNCIIHATIM